MGVKGTVFGQVVKLDRGFPLVFLGSGVFLRCKHATALIKDHGLRAAVGDRVEVDASQGGDKALIVRILPRERALIRKDPTERVLPQTLAANFDIVIVAQPLAEVNIRRLERELVLAFETGARVAVVLTKADLAEGDAQVDEVRHRVCDVIGDAPLLVVSADSPESVDQVRALVPSGTVAVLMGRSGVGKSSLVNMLVGESRQAVAPVRASDGKGRHTTVSREMVSLPGGGAVIDTPGVRGLGLWDAEDGIRAAFPDIEEHAASCRFRDCRHADEPGCAVRAAVSEGRLSAGRVEAYRALREENDALRAKRDEAERIRRRSSSQRRRPR